MLQYLNSIELNDRISKLSKNNLIFSRHVPCRVGTKVEALNGSVFVSKIQRYVT